VYTEVVSINRKAKEVTVRNVVSGQEYTESYDKLVLSPGAKAIVPPIKGIEDVNVFTVRNVVDIAKLDSFIKDNSKNISVIGGGFIGVEVAENLHEAGYN
ncbi:NAD(P)/FAD-dependent oxidoreductase, partial (plasmid) [Clostridium perfringens]